MNHRRTWLLAAGLFALPALSGCVAADDEPTHEQLGAAAAAIEGGYADSTTTHAVGLVRQGNWGIESSCSGTLIAPNVVLTAHHCVSPTSSHAVQCSVISFGNAYSPSDMLVTTKPEFTSRISDYHRVAEIHIPPDGPLLCGRDVAIMILEEPIGPEEAIPATPRVDEPLTNETYYAIGYGQTFDSDNAPSGRRMRRDDLTVACVGDECGTPNILYTSEWRGETAVCSGDSGGPAFDMLNRVIGVASRGVDGCEQPTYEDAYSWAWWIKEITIYASGLTGTEPPPWATGWPTDPAYSYPVGGVCSAPESCESNLCLGGYCTRLCNEAAPCEQGYECNGDGFCEKVAAPPSNNGDDDDGETTVSSCNYGDADPTKPIPWKTAPLLLGALALYLRRRREG